MSLQSMFMYLYIPLKILKQSYNPRLRHNCLRKKLHVMIRDFTKNYISSIFPNMNNIME